MWFRGVYVNAKDLVKLAGCIGFLAFIGIIALIVVAMALFGVYLESIGY